ncbi:MAG: hypothetical protein Q9212_001838 [Teloschistes hypoglaucus]
MVNQLEKNEHSITEMLPKPRFIVKERQRLAISLFQSTTETSFAQIVRDLSTLCAWRAVGGSTVKSHGLHLCDELNNLEAMTDIEFSSAEKPGTSKDITRKPAGHGFDKTSKPRERMEEETTDEEEDSTDEGSTDKGSTDKDSTDNNRREKVAPVEAMGKQTLQISTQSAQTLRERPFSTPSRSFRLSGPRLQREFAEHASTVYYNLIGVRVTLKSSEDVREKHLKDSRKKMDKLVPQTMIDE